LEYQATGLAGQSFIKQKSVCGLSSPWGEGTGEGGQKTNMELAPPKSQTRNAQGKTQAISANRRVEWVKIIY
jgi:hypothetical protein